jgi:uncharacterized protein (TIGR01777 family)
METAGNSAVIVSGASGLLGSALRSALAARRIPLIQLVRRAPNEEGQLQWNPLEGPAIHHAIALEGCAAAIHFCGASIAGHRWTAGYRRELAISRIDSTRALAAILAELSRPPKAFLVASAVGVYGNRADEVLTEASPAGDGFLADLCVRWETAAEAAEKAGIRVVHLRFGVVLDSGQGALARMLPVFRFGLGGTLGDGRQWMSWISLPDAIRAVLLALDTPSLAGPVNVTAPNPATNSEFTSALAGQLGRPSFLPVPALALRLAFGEMANEALLASTRVIPEKLNSAGFRFEHPTVDKGLAAALLRSSAVG